MMEGRQDERCVWAQDNLSVFCDSYTPPPILWPRKQKRITTQCWLLFLCFKFVSNLQVHDTKWWISIRGCCCCCWGEQCVTLRWWQNKGTYNKNKKGWRKRGEKKRGCHDWSFNVIFKSLTTCSGNGCFGWLVVVVEGDCDCNCGWNKNTGSLLVGGEGGGGGEDRQLWSNEWMNGLSSCKSIIIA